MKLKVYDTVEDFLTENEGLLYENEAVCQLLLKNALRNRDEKTRKDMLFARVEDKGETIALLCHVKPWNLCLVDFCKEEKHRQLAELVAGYMIDEGVDFRGISAGNKLAEAFAKYLLACTSWALTLHSAMDIMVLHTLRDVTTIRDRVRLAQAGDLATLANWDTAFIDEIGEGPAQYKDCKETIRGLIAAGQMYVFEEMDGRLCSMAAARRDLRRGVSVGHVYTPESERGKGYCTAAMHALCKDFLAQRYEFITLYVDQKNPYSNRVYKKLGFETTKDWCDCRF